MTFQEELAHTAPPDIRVLPVEKAFDEMLAICRDKDMFTRPMWLEEGWLAKVDDDQLRECIKNWGNELAVWMAPTFFRMLKREWPTVGWSCMVVGKGLNDDNLFTYYQAMWDVGIREIHYLLSTQNLYTDTVKNRALHSVQREIVLDTGRNKWVGVTKIKERPWH
jgi:hypothetical protein